MATSKTDLPPAELLASNSLTALLEWCDKSRQNDFCDENVGSHYEYIISIPANVLFIAIFALCLIAYLGTYAATRRALTYNIALSLGVICEAVGYGGRVWSYYRPYLFAPFVMQIVCLTIGPAFMAASIYLCLRRIVMAFGRENSYIAPVWYTRTFIACDIIALILQGAGGGIASSGSSATNGSRATLDAGTNVMIAGLVFQVVVIICFILAAASFVFRLRRRLNRMGPSAMNQSPDVVAVRNSPKFKFFIGCLTVSIVAILIRSAYRIAELNEGWTGPIIRRQDLFIGMEGALISLAAVLLAIGSPSFCFGNFMDTEPTEFNGEKGPQDDRTAVSTPLD